MIENFGIGIDIVEINRFRSIPYDINPRFYKKIFSPSEIKYCLKYKDHARRFAAKFSIKEATKKSIRENISFLEIQTSHLNSKPIVKLRNCKKYRFLTSVSHENDLAVAVVISERIT